MYRDDAEALLARAEALQVEVDQLRAELERRDAPVPPPMPAPRPRHTPPPLPSAPLKQFPPGWLSEQLDRTVLDPRVQTPSPQALVNQVTVQVRDQLHAMLASLPSSTAALLLHIANELAFQRSDDREVLITALRDAITWVENRP